MPTIDEMMGAFAKEYGSVMFTGNSVPVVEGRLPTSFFPLDMNLGGGLPLGKVSVIYGTEGSMKTTIALKAVMMHQRLFPDKVCVYVDLEGHYDPAWAAQVGVDIDKLRVVWPDYGEQAVDIVEELVTAQDVGLLVMDSLAAMVPSHEVEKSADVASVGTAGLLISKFYRKLSRAINLAKKQGIVPTIILINQIRMKIGVMYGNPETTPGGKAINFMSALTLRVSGKDETDTKIDKVNPVWKMCNVSVKKKKIPIVGSKFEFRMSLDPRTGIQLSDSNDWPLVKTVLQEYGLLTKEKEGWVVLGKAFKTQDKIRAQFLCDIEFSAELRAVAIGAVMQVVDESAQDDKSTEK